MSYNLEDIFAEYGEKLLRYATSILYNHQDAEDVVQDVFVAAHQHLSTFDGQNLQAWLYKITYNKSINKLRRRRFLVFVGIPANTVAPESTGFSHEILHALGQLKPKDRALLYARIIEGCSYEELAQQMGGTAASLRKRYERARKKAAEYINSRHTKKGEYVHEQH